MNWRALGITVSAFVLSGYLVSCSLSPDVMGTQRAAADLASASKNPLADNFQVVGQVKVDEFNDLATGKETPREGGQLVVQVRAEPDSVNPWTDTSAYSSYVTGLIYNSLLRQDPETFGWEGSLAERWTEGDVVVRSDGKELVGQASYSGPGETGDVLLRTQSGDTLRLTPNQVREVRKGVVFTFYLRHGVKFHDGYPLTAADVKFSFDTIKNEYVDAPSLRTYYNDLKSCEILDPYTVQMTYSKQYWQAREFAGGFEILPKHIYDADNLLETDPQAFGKRFNESEYNRQPIGTGPYQFERWDTGNQIILTRNPDYWDVPRRGHLNRIIFRFITDDVAAITALKAGDVNFVPEAAGEQFDQETAPAFLSKFAKAQYYLGGFRYVGWNMRRPPFNDVRVRLAMAYGALDRPKFIDSVLHGHGIVVTGSQNYFGPAYDHSIQPYPFDPEKAKQLLLEAGWYDRDGDGLRDKDGRPFRFEMLMPSGFETYRRRAALMKENLRKLGIDMTVRELEWATFLENINDRKFDACSLGWGTPIESDPYQIWHSSQSENRGSNLVGFVNAAADHLIEQSRVTLDDAARRKLFFELHRIQHEQQPYLFMYTEPNLGIYDKRFRGVKFYRVRPGWDLSEWYLSADEIN
jgi:peptide/nickel transport system substrate-binding protein